MPLTSSRLINLMLSVEGSDHSIIYQLVHDLGILACVEGTQLLQTTHLDIVLFRIYERDEIALLHIVHEIPVFPLILVPS